MHLFGKLVLMTALPGDLPGGQGIQCLNAWKVTEAQSLEHCISKCYVLILDSWLRWATLCFLVFGFLLLLERGVISE